jgi:colanic acid/amylovoran biosynthesis protein
MKVLVTNVYSWENKGDAAIVLAMIEDIKHQLNPEEIVITSHDPRDEGKYGAYKVFPSFLYLIKGTVGAVETFKERLKACLSYRFLRLRLLIFVVCNTLGMHCYWLFSNKISQKLRYYEKSSIILACGGGYLQSTTRRRKLESLFGFSELECLCLEFSLANIFKKPYILYNQSIGPFFDNNDEEIVRKHLKGASVVICREELSLSRMKNNGLNNLFLRSDIAFTLASKETFLLNKYSFDKNNRNIGITVKKCLGNDKQIEYEKILSEFIVACLKEDSTTMFYFIPQVINKIYGDDDLEVARKICGTLPIEARSHTHIISEDIHPGEIKYIISLMAYFVGTRMHSNIFALASGVRTLALAYDLKTDGIMQMLGLSDYVIPVADVTLDKLKSLFTTLVADSNYDKILQDNIGRIKTNATFDLNKFMEI